RCDHALDLFGLEKRYALVAVLLTKPFQDIPAGAPSLRRQLTERPGVEITHHRGGHGTRLHGLGGDLNTRSSLNRGLPCRSVNPCTNFGGRRIRDGPIRSLLALADLAPPRRWSTPRCRLVH